MSLASPANPLALDPATVERAQRDYEAVLPRIRAHAEVKFRYLRDPGKHDDAVANTIGLGWKHWLSALRHGKDPNEFVSSIADMAARQAGRRWPQGQERAKDVMSSHAQRHRGFTVQSLPDHPDTGQDDNATIDALADMRQASPADQAAFRADTRAWLESLGAKGQIVEEMALGESTTDLARRFRKSEGRISQIRGEAAESYRRFHGEDRGR